MQSRILKTINDYYNKKIEYVSDFDQHGKKDHWMAPDELIESGKGDCEDFAIAKFYKCLQANIPARIVYVIHESHGPHMVCTVQCGTDRWVLDNLVPELMVIEDRTDLTEVYSFDLHNLWIRGERVSDSDKISLFKPIRTELIEELNA